MQVDASSCAKTCRHYPERLTANRQQRRTLRPIRSLGKTATVAQFEMPKLEINTDELRPLVQAVVAETLAQANGVVEKLHGRLGFPEAEAAALLGVERHVLRDARLRGEIEASRVGKRIVYTPEQIKAYLARNQWEPS